MEQTTDSSKKSIWEVIKFTLIAVVVIYLIRTFIAQPFIVSGASMDPNFKTGEYLIIDELSYNLFTNPARGDVIVFRYPKEPKTFFIKRIIGLPGETIKITEGKVKIFNSEFPDGLELNETYVSDSHKSADSFDTTLGSDQYFVMGDNRAESLDSRAWGPLENKFIIGKPFVRLLPFERIGFSPGKELNY